MGEGGGHIRGNLFLFLVCAIFLSNHISELLQIRKEIRFQLQMSHVSFGVNAHRKCLNKMKM